MSLYRKANHFLYMYFVYRIEIGFALASESNSFGNCFPGGCPRESDGPFCWPPRLVGETAILACPPYLPMGATGNF